MGKFTVDKKEDTPELEELKYRIRVEELKRHILQDEIHNINKMLTNLQWEYRTKKQWKDI